MTETKLLRALESATRHGQADEAAKILCALEYKRDTDPGHVATLSALAHEYQFAALSADGRTIADPEAWAHAERLFGHLRGY